MRVRSFGGVNNQLETPRLLVSGVLSHKSPPFFSCGLAATENYHPKP